VAPLRRRRPRFLAPPCCRGEELRHRLHRQPRGVGHDMRRSRTR
jgi:hypothetical protein